ncbi:MAG: T9SS type A sorting domain-containing protein, partial [Ginsengibacter sp.]
DVFIGSSSGDIVYYKNTGSASMPVFTEQTGSNNPLNVNVGYYSSPTFADIDLDGKKDAVIGIEFSSIIYYKNTGTNAAPVFTEQTGASNPFAAVAVSSYGSPAFVDIDNDGDPDVFFGDGSGEIFYYENTSLLLPLQLLSFSGNKQAGYNELQWQTAKEINTKTFEPERSTDGRTFTEIGSINAAGNGGNSYLFKDNGLNTGKVFYRLKMVDIDGRFTYSRVIWLNGERGGISIYPNPVTDVVNIHTGDATILKTMAGFYDVNGRLVKNILITNNQQQINIQQLPNGMYMIKFADGTSKSFIKE